MKIGKKLFVIAILVVIGGVWLFTDVERVCEPQPCLIGYDHYYCEPFRYKEPFLWNITENRIYCEPYYPNECGHCFCYPVECEYIEYIDGEAICYPVEEACIRQFTGAYCPGETCSYRVSWVNLFGGGLILFGLYLIHKSGKKENET